MSPLQQRARARVGTLLKEKWRLESLLGVGGTAAVYAAAHRNGKRAAIKILHRELSTNTELVGRFLREGYVANKLEHPGAVSVLDDDHADDGSVFLVMELLEGYSLERHTRQNAERLSLDQVLRIGDEILDVLASAHTKGVIHRDIKPANLFLTRDGRLKVLDFGIARLTEGTDVSTTQTGAAIGTPAFMPPEQARGRWNLVDARTDLWAVGATLFALLTGHRPRRAETVNEELLLAMTEPVPKLSQVAPHVPRPIADVIDRALEFDMAARWPTSRAMQFALREARDSLPSQASDPLSVPSAQPDTALVVKLPPAPPPIAIAHVPPPPPAAPADAMDARLTTSRPMVTSGLFAGAPAGRRGKLGALFGVAAVLSIACGVGAAFVLQHASSATPSLKVSAKGEPDARTAPAAVAPPPPTTSAVVPSPTTVTLADLPLSPTPAATPLRTAAPTTKTTPSAKPSAAASTSGNPWDSRF